MNRLHPATMIVAFLPKLYDAFRQVLPFLAISFLSGREDRTELFVAAIGVLGGFGAIVAYLTTRYGFQEGALVCTSGWLFKRDRRIPLDQIQNVNLKQGMLERLLRVVTLEVETAAGSGSELKLQVITELEAEHLRSQLSASVAVAAPGSHPLSSGQVVYKMDRSDLLLGAMAENQGSQIIFALLGTVGAAAMAQLAERFFQFKDFMPDWLYAIAGVLAVGGIWMLGWIYGGLQYAVKFAHFTVRREPGIFRIAHGLFTKFQYTVRIKRVEIAMITSTVWQRAAKRVTVRVGTAGSFGEQGTTAPIALMLPENRILETVQSVLPNFQPERLEWKRYPAFYLTMSLARTAIILAIIAGIAWFMTHSFITRVLPDVQWFVPTVVTILYIWILANLVISYRKSHYAISEDYLAVKGGFFRRTFSFMPMSRVDTASTFEPRWWSKRGVTRLHANAMVHSLTIEMLPFEDAERVMEWITIRRGNHSGMSLNLSVLEEPPDEGTINRDDA